MNIAVFSDVHGRILLAFALCARWERETGERIDLMLQAGDLGAYPDGQRLDRATIKHAKADPEELGFLTHFIERKPEVTAILDSTDCPMIFVRGNHEDHFGSTHWKARRASRSSRWIPTTGYSASRPVCPIRRPLAPMPCLWLGIGRVGQPLGAQAKPKYLQPDESERLHSLGSSRPDILLTHDVPRDASEGRGMEEIRLILDACAPRYYFYGHTEEPYQQHLDRNGVTTAIRMADLNWERGARRGLLPPGVIGMLRWHDRDDNSFEVVDAPWLDEYSAWMWRRIADETALG